MANNHFRTRAIIAASIVLSVSPIWCSADSETVDFNRDIRPILSDKCFHCHGPDVSSRETDLRFDVEESAKSDLGGYAAIVPNEPDESELLIRVSSSDDSEIMPPPEINKALSQSEIELLRRWIEQGAEWAAHWAYVPPENHASPEPAPSDTSKEWPKNWIDHFVLERLRTESLSPSPPADSITLVRRLCFDLTGLPPTADQIESFEKIGNDEEYAAFVDSLLESAAFGERMATWWLDLVRFADTVGYHGDQDQNVGLYRSWVIHALNDNMPFDQFTLEQLAGDLLPNPTIDQKIATGYNRLLQTTHEGGLQPKEYRAIYAADRVRNVSAVWMGATLGCAQCHDHKYDPYTAKDFYAMSAFFADIDDEKHLKVGTNNIPTIRPPELILLDESQEEEVAVLKEELAVLSSKQKELKTAIDKLEAITAEDELEGQERSSIQEELDAAHAKLKTIDAERKATKKRIETINNSVPRSLITVPLKEPRVTRILPRGNWQDESGEIVNPATPSFLPPLSGEERLNRKDLAQWLMDKENGYGLMLARVYANRFWYLFFGTGISDVLEDLGGQGQPPTHPELLDNLAMAFAADWDVKNIVKLIVTSAAYQQQSARSPELRTKDPLNRLIAAQSSSRLSAEMVRDNALAISGLLETSIGGPKAKPYQPAGYYRHLNFPKRKYSHDTGRQQYRRGVYVHWQRQFLHPMFKAFDAPNREECTASRPESNTPLAALALLNDPTFVEAARVFAEDILARHIEDDARISYAFHKATSRQPTSTEIERLRRLLEEQKAHFSSSKESTEKLTSIGLSKVRTGKSFNAKDLAAWTMVTRAILNLDETITRN